MGLPAVAVGGVPQNTPCSRVAMFKTELDRRTETDGGFQIKSPGQARSGRVDVHGARCAGQTLPAYSGRMLSGTQRFLKPSSAAVPTAAANEQYYDDDDDQKSCVVHIPAPRP
jgi:hypothetical protein